MTPRLVIYTEIVKANGESKSLVARFISPDRESRIAALHERRGHRRR